jgi:hypothetical protein
MNLDEVVVQESRVVPRSSSRQVSDNGDVFGVHSREGALLQVLIQY